MVHVSFVFLLIKSGNFSLKEDNELEPLPILTLPLLCPPKSVMVPNSETTLCIRSQAKSSLLSWPLTSPGSLTPNTFCLSQTDP